MAQLRKCTQTILFHNYRNCRIIASVNSCKIKFQKVSKVTGNTEYIDGTTLHNQVQPLPDLQPSDVMTKISLPRFQFKVTKISFHTTFRNVHTKLSQRPLLEQQNEYFFPP